MKYTQPQSNTKYTHKNKDRKYTSVTNSATIQYRLSPATNENHTGIVYTMVVNVMCPQIEDENWTQLRMTSYDHNTSNLLIL
jgi:hypothetical protein